MTQTEERTGIYNRKHSEYAYEQAKLARWTGSERNKELLRAFHTHVFAQGTKGERVAKLSWELRKICDHLGKDLDAWTHKDAAELVAWINQSAEWTELTKSDYRRCLKTFFRWFEEEDPRMNNGDADRREEARRLYQFIEKHVKSTYRKRSLDYATIITDQDNQLLLEKGCATAMERALVAFLHETGCRVGELLGVRLRDLERKERHAMVRLDGKTGERRVPIIQSLPHLYRWLQDHPDRENPAALLWVSLNNRFHHQPLRYIGVCRLLRRVFQRAGLKKRHNPHWFRHSRATLSAPRYSEAILCKIMGWTLGSAQVKTYVHLGAGQVEDAFLKSHGLAEPERIEQKVQFCVCGTVNEPGKRYCGNCGNALSVGVMLEDEERKRQSVNEAFAELAKILSDPARRAAYEAFLKNGGGA